MKLKTRKLIPPLEYALSYGVERRKKDIPTHKHTIYLTLGIWSRNSFMIFIPYGS